MNEDLLRQQYMAQKQDWRSLGQALGGLGAFYTAERGIMEKISECKKEKETAASIVLSTLEATANKAEKLACVVTEKTNSVTRQEPVQTPPVTGQNVPSELNQQWPPLFGRIKELTESINNSLDRIADIMRRCEL